jgi:hypothetical protein
MADKLDLKKSLDAYQAKRGQFRIVEVPDLQYLMIDGHGDPNTSLGFAEALETLYAVAYSLKFASKLTLDRDYVVMPLEGLWWADDHTVFMTGDKSRWDWTVLMQVPDWIDLDMVEAAVEASRKKTGGRRYDDLRLETLREGLSVQTLHVGSFDTEAEVLTRMHEEFIPEHGLAMTGKHHEVYLSDSRKTAADRLRTLLRQPVRPAG